MRDALDEGDYYRATSGGTPYAPLSGAHDAAICIIGGGFAGLATAMSLMERGETNIVLLEGEEIGFGASGRSGGFVFGGFSRSEYGVAGTVGLEEGRKLYHLTLAAVELIRTRITRYAIDCDACEKGIYLANWFEDPKEIDDHRAFMDESMGVQWQSLNRAQLGEHLATTCYSGALYEPRAFHFNPLKYVQGLARALHAGGVRVHERSKVTTLEADGAGWRVRTGPSSGAGAGTNSGDGSGSGEVRAREVVVCCGGYIERLYPKLADAVLPIATYVMVTEPLGERLGTALATQAAVYDNRFAFDYYRPLPDTRLLWGGRISVRERGSADVARMLYRDMVKVYPQLAGTRVDYAWSGRMSYGRHRMVQLGRLPDGLWYGMGFGGHGVAPTTLAGEVLAGALRGDGVDLARFAPWGLPAAGGAAGLFAAQLAYWAFELRDWMRR